MYLYREWWIMKLPVHQYTRSPMCSAKWELVKFGYLRKKNEFRLPADSGIVPGYSRIAQGVCYRFLLYPGIGLTKWGFIAFLHYINKNKEHIIYTSIKHYTKKNQKIVSRLIRICIPHMFKNTDYPEICNCLFIKWHCDLFWIYLIMC